MEACRFFYIFVFYLKSMRNKIEQFFKEQLFFINRYSDTSIELRFFYLVCLVGTISCFAGNITSIVLGLDIWLFFATSIVSFACFTSFYIAKKQNSSRLVAWPLIIITFGVLSITWFFNAGLEAPNMLFFVLVTLSSTIIVPNSQKFFVLLLSIFLFTCCMLLEMEFPHWVQNHHTLNKRKVDFLIIYPVITALCFWILNVAIRHHQDAKTKSDNENDTKNKLLSILSHDLRGPFATMTNALRYLNQEDSTITEGEHKMLLRKLYESTSTTSMLIDNLLHWTLAQRDGLHLTPVVLDIELEIKEVTKLLKSSAQEKRIKILSTYDINRMIYADSNSVSIIFRNLISNAIKFTYESGIIEIIVTEKDGFAKVMIKDTGVGMSNQQIQQANEQVLVSTFGTKNEKGSGLGLPVCHEFLKANNGYLEISSQEGKGSEFTAYLPLN